jgi:hypothetical protein
MVEMVQVAYLKVAIDPFYLFHRARAANRNLDAINPMSRRVGVPETSTAQKVGQAPRP